MFRCTIGRIKLPIATRAFVPGGAHAIFYGNHFYPGAKHYITDP